jgi:hypothetical protein
MKPSPTKRRRSHRRHTRFNLHELALEPWFLPRGSRLAINALIPPGYRNKMRDYFDDYGCMRCEEDGIYDANGMCVHCHHLVRRRLKACLTRRMPDAPDDRIDLIMGRRKKLASKLLGRFAQPWSKMSLRHRLNGSNLKNPVDQALGFLTPGGRGHYGSPPPSASQDGSVLGKSVKDLRPGRTGR